MTNTTLIWAAAAILGLAYPPAPAFAGEAPIDHVIVVTGLGEASAAPDVVFLQIGVESQGATASDALRKNSSQMESTMKMLRDNGVASKDMQTSNLSVSARYDYSRDETPPKLIGYQAANSLSVKLRDLKSAGSIIDKTIGAGANRLDSISFSISDHEPLLDEARKAAIKNAKAKAKLYADAAGVKLGPVVQISESTAQVPTPIRAVSRVEMAGANAVPLAAGENTVSASITLTYRIE